MAKKERLIYADELRKVIDTSLTQYLSRLVDQDDVLEAIDNTPTVDAEPVRHGHWLGKPIAGYATVRCSNCKSAFLENKGIWKYCPNCGTKMDEEAKK